MDPSSTDRVLRKCRLLVVKSTERCNLNCSYCYMYNGGDQSYLSRPPVMSMQTARKMFERVEDLPPELLRLTRQVHPDLVRDPAGVLAANRG